MDKELKIKMMSLLDKCNEALDLCNSISFHKNFEDISHFDNYLYIIFGIMDDIPLDDFINHSHKMVYHDIIKKMSTIYEQEYKFEHVDKYSTNYDEPFPVDLSLFKDKVGTFKTYVYVKKPNITTQEFLDVFNCVFLNMSSKSGFASVNEYCEQMMIKFIKLIMSIIITSFEKLTFHTLESKIYNSEFFIKFIYIGIYAIIMQMEVYTLNMLPFVKKIIDAIRKLTNPNYIRLNCNYISETIPTIQTSTDYCCGRFVTHIINDSTPTKIIITNTDLHGRPDVEYEKKIQENPNIETTNGIKYGGGGNFYKKYIKYKCKYLKLKGKY